MSSEHEQPMILRVTIAEYIKMKNLMARPHNATQSTTGRVNDEEILAALDKPTTVSEIARRTRRCERTTRRALRKLVNSGSVTIDDTTRPYRYSKASDLRTHRP